MANVGIVVDDLPATNLRVMFAVDDIDETLARLGEHGAQLVSSEVVRFEDAYRLCYVRGPGGLLIGLAEELREAARNP